MVGAVVVVSQLVEIRKNGARDDGPLLLATRRGEAGIERMQHAVVCAHIDHRWSCYLSCIPERVIAEIGIAGERLLNEHRLGIDDVLSLIHISEPTRLLSISYAVFCL